MLVDFEPDDPPFDAIVDAKAELSALLGGREVDLIRRSSLNRWVRARVFGEVEELYDRAGDQPVERAVSDDRPRRRPSRVERDTLSFGHMLDAAREAVEIAAGVDRTRFDSDRLLRLGLTHLVQIVGEAVRKVSAEGRAAHPEIPWQAIVGMRHVLVDEDDEVNERKVWETVVEDLPVLVAAIEAFLPRPPD